MYKVYQIVYTGPYGSGMGLVAAQDRDQAIEYTKEYYKEHIDAKYFSVDCELTYLKSTKKGVLESKFYIE